MNDTESNQNSTTSSPQSGISTGPMLRCLFVLLGLLLVVIGTIGAFLPGIPTAGPLLAASFFFTKSSPALERRLVRNRFFAGYLQRLEVSATHAPIKFRAYSIASMWISITLSCCLLWQADTSGWVIGSIVLAGVAGTICICRFKRSWLVTAHEGQRLQVFVPPHG